MIRTAKEMVTQFTAPRIDSTAYIAGKVNMGSTPEEIAQEIEDVFERVGEVCDVDRSDLVDEIERRLSEFEEEYGEVT